MWFAADQPRSKMRTSADDPRFSQLVRWVLEFWESRFLTACHNREHRSCAFVGARLRVDDTHSFRVGRGP